MHQLLAHLRKTNLMPDAGRKSLADAMGDPETCGAIFRALDYLCKRDPGAVVDKATENAWRWFCETHYNDGRGEPVEPENKKQGCGKTRLEFKRPE
jgi:hypothetical protein